MNSKLVCFEKEGDGRCCSVLANNPLATVLVLVSLYFSSDEDLRGNTAKLVAREVRVTDFVQTWAARGTFVMIVGALVTWAIYTQGQLLL